MKYVYILENDTKFRDEMVEAIQKVDPQMGIRWFTSLEHFAKWIKSVFQEGPLAIAKGGLPMTDMGTEITAAANDQLVLVISKDEFLGAKHMALLRKTRDLFIAKGLCTPEDPTSLVITSFESPDFDIKLAEDRIINNVIFKPFDKLILQQHLTFAISGHHPPSQYSIHNMKSSATIEMLKEVPVEAISDVGFISISNREISVGSVSKYYGESFLSLKHRSMMAICLRCEPHPEIAGHFRCAFSFFSADSFQITNIRKVVRRKDLLPTQFEWIPSVTRQPLHIALLSSDEVVTQNFKDLIARQFDNVHVHTFVSLQTLLFAADHELAKKDKSVDVATLPVLPPFLNAIFAEDHYFSDGFEGRWQNILETLQKRLQPPNVNITGKTDLYVLSKRFYTDAEERALGAVVKDIFFLPLDSLYFAKKISLFMPHLSSKETLNLPTVLHPHITKVANPIEISEFSEAGLVIKYYRPISTGAFREFVLWLPHELDLPEFLATCNFSEENKSEKGQSLNHFVFFGMKDHYLKHIRLWILQNHVHSKESEGA